MIHRRRLIATAATSPLTAPLLGHAQTVPKVHRIGILGNFVTGDATGPQPRSPYTNAFLRGMRELGYGYGEHFVTEPRGSAGDAERFPMLAAELVGPHVDVIVAAGQALPALKQATSTLPIVMTAANDPVGTGYVQSLARPGGNMTGLSLRARKGWKLVSIEVRNAGDIERACSLRLQWPCRHRPDDAAALMLRADEVIQ